MPEEFPMKKLLKPANLIMPILLSILLVIEIYPTFWLLISSVKAPSEFSLHPIYALPETFYWQNYVKAWTAGKMSIYFRNSILVVFPAIFFTMLVSVMAAFALEVMQWKLKNTVLMTFLAGVMVPGQIVLLPLFTMYYTLHLTNSLLGLMMIYIAFGLPLTIFLMTGYMKAVPREVFEAAVMDGANIFQIFSQIAVPMIANSIVTLALVQFFFVWNDLLLSLTFISDTKLRTLQTGLLSFVGQYGQREWGPTFASIAITVIPTLLLYLFLNKLIIKGLTAGAVKG
jgi:raffinose/stachyose/melibiose transport system permease protein